MLPGRTHLSELDSKMNLLFERNENKIYSTSLAQICLIKYLEIFCKYSNTRVHANRIEIFQNQNSLANTYDGCMDVLHVLFLEKIKSSICKYSRESFVVS